MAESLPPLTLAELVTALDNLPDCIALRRDFRRAVGDAGDLELCVLSEAPLDCQSVSDFTGQCHGGRHRLGRPTTRG